MSLSIYSNEDAITAIATPLMPSALAIIRLSGKNSVDLLSTLFSRPRALTQAKGNTLVYGWIISDAKTKVDEVMIAVYRKPKSFTGEEMAEIFCHGGTAVVLAILTLLLKNGFRQAHPGEFSCRAFINGKTDLTKAEAIREIIEAQTDESRLHAVQRLEGSLLAEIITVKKALISAIAEIDAGIEYPEDEDNIVATFNPQRIIAIQKTLYNLSESWKTEKLYQDGIKIVLLGKTNAGKSSLFNALLKENRSIVSNIHGTTRDWLESSLSIDGVPVQLFDTAGIRETADEIEKEGVKRTLQLAEEADLLLYLFDISIGLGEDEQICISNLQTKSIPCIIVANKIDTVIEQKNQSSDFIAMSIKNNIGINDLTAKIKTLLPISKNVHSESAGIGSKRQKQAVDSALESVNHALAAKTQGFSLDAVIQDLENALFFLGEVTGETSGEDILDAVFSEFCVGK